MSPKLEPVTKSETFEQARARMIGPAKQLADGRGGPPTLDAPNDTRLDTRLGVLPNDG